LRTLEGILVLALLVVVDKDDIPQEKFLGVYGFQKFDAKSISERMLSILHELICGNFLHNATMERR